MKDLLRLKIFIVSHKSSMISHVLLYCRLQALDCGNVTELCGRKKGLGPDGQIFQPEKLVTIRHYLLFYPEKTKNLAVKVLLVTEVMDREKTFSGELGETF